MITTRFAFTPPPELSDSPAGPPVWCRLAQGFLTALLIILFCPLLAPAALAQAQTVLLDTIGSGVGNTGEYEFAAPFTTGTHPYGYTISEVVFPLSSRNSNAGPVVVTIRERTSGNRPGKVVATLNNPSTFVVIFDMNENTFTAPPGTTLSPNTTYYLVFNDGNAGTQPIHSAGRNARASRGGGKSDGLDDWDIPNLEAGPTKALRRNSPNGSWQELVSGLQFSIKGGPFDFTPTPVNNPAPLHAGPCIPWTYGTPRGYCLAKQTAGASDDVGSDLPLPGNPAAFIENESGEKDVHGRTILEIRETSCGTNTGSFRIRTLNWRFPGPPAVADPKVWVVATTGERWVSHGPGNDRFRSSVPRIIAGGAKLRLDGEYGLPVPVAPHDGERVVEVRFTVESDTNDSFEFQLLASRDANQKYNMLGWIGGGTTGNTQVAVSADDVAWGPTVHVEFIKNRNLSCPDAMSGSNSPPEPQPDLGFIAVGVGEPAEGDGESGDENDNDVAEPIIPPNPHADLIADVRGYAGETHNGQDHVDRWLQVLAAFGDDNGHEPMTAVEAQTYADRGWTRWDAVVTALTELEAEPEPEPELEPEPEPAACVSDELENDVLGYSKETVSTNSELQSAYVERWLRVRQTFSGTANDSTIMLPSEAQTYADRGWTRWVPVAAALQCLAQQALNGN